MNLLGSVLDGLLGGQPANSSLAGVVGNLLAGQPGGGVMGGLLGGGQAGGQSGGVLGGLLGGQQPQQPAPGGVGGGVGGGMGGLMGLLDRFQQAGLGHVAQSWVGTGPNEPVSPQQLEQVFGQNQVQQMAQQANMPQQDFLSQLSQVLPQAVDRLTPDGRLPPADALGGAEQGGMPGVGGGRIYRT